MSAVISREANVRSSIARIGPELVAMACVALAALIVLRAPQGIASDQLFQLTAMNQYIVGESPSINRLVTVDEVDLGRDIESWIDFWPPGFTVLAYAGASAGLADGTSSRIISLLGVTIGVLLWLAWSRRIGVGQRAVYLLAVALPWTRHVSAMSLETSAEALLFAFTPGLLLLADRVRTDGGLHRSVAIGLLGGAAFLCKYSAGVTFVAALAAAWIAATLARRKLVLPFAIATATFAAIAASWTIVSAEIGSGLGNSALDTMQLRSGWALNPILAIANVGLSVADLGAPLAHFTQALGARIVVGLALFALALAVIGERRLRQHAFTMSFVGATAVLLATIWTFSGAADYNHRHAMQAGLALLPLLVMRLEERPARRWLNAIGVMLLLASTVYGSASLVAKSSRNAVDAGASDGLWGQFLTWRGAASARRMASESCGGIPPTWFVVDRLSALRLGGRRMGMGAEFWSRKRLGSPRDAPASLCVAMLIPDAMEADGRGRILRSSFASSLAWQRVAIDGSAFPLWIGRRTTAADR